MSLLSKVQNEIGIPITVRNNAAHEVVDSLGNECVIKKRSPSTWSQDIATAMRHAFFTMQYLFELWQAEVVLIYRIRRGPFDKYLY